MSVKVALKMVEDEIYSLRKQYQCLKDLVYVLAADNTDNAVTIRNWVETQFESLCEMNAQVESVSDIKTFLKNVIKDHCTFNE